MIGIIKSNKIYDHIIYKKYKHYNIPFKDQKKNNWKLKCFDCISKKEFINTSNILNIMSEYSKNNLIFYYCYGDRKNIICEEKELRIDHCHSFNEVIEILYNFPVTFNIPSEYEHFYSESELQFLKKLQNKLLEDGLLDIGKFYINNEIENCSNVFNIKYDYQELRKRNIKKIYGVSLNKHEKLMSN